MIGRGADVVQLSPKLLAAKRNGAKGGKAVMAKYGQAFAEERAERGGSATRDKYGTEFFRHIRSMRLART